MLKQLEERKKQVLEFVLMDDTFFAVAFEDMAACEEFIRTITGINDLVITENKTQYSIRNIGEHSVILDLLAFDSKKNVYCIEIQKANDDNHQRRVRFNQANVDVSMLDKGMKYEELPTVISIFVSKTDILHGAKACYHVDRVVRETGAVLDNGRQEIYVNAENDDGTVIASLMKEFQEKELSDKFPRIADRVHYLKHDEKGVCIMCEKMQKIIDEERKDAAKKAAKEASFAQSKETAEKLIKTTDWDDEHISEIVSLSKDVVAEIRTALLQHA